jgi:hypothetical protein
MFKIIIRLNEMISYAAVLHQNICLQCKWYMIPILMLRMHISTNYVSSMMLMPKSCISRRERYAFVKSAKNGNQIHQRIDLCLEKKMNTKWYDTIVYNTKNEKLFYPKFYIYYKLQTIMITYNASYTCIYNHISQAKVTEVGSVYPTYV